MPFSQDDRPLKVNTPLGKDVLLIQSLSGEEGLSQLFHFQLELLAENKTDVAFDQLLGQKITVSVRLPKGERHFHGICNRIAQGGRDRDFTRYNLEIVPQLWLLTRRLQSRIFQHETVPDILKKVLKGIDSAFELQGSFPKRDYCAQYRESDFAFASRLMEEEGIYYFFKHTADGHKLVLANSPSSHAEVPVQATVIYEEVEGGNREELRVSGWQKVQEIRSGKYTLWDHYFELPQKHLEAEKSIQESVQVGKVTHKLKVGGNAELEVYDYPGGFSEWFDGVDAGGGDQAAEVKKVFDENQRVAAIRMQQEALGSLEIQGQSNCGHFMAGHKFTLERHFNADGQYVLTQVTHAASLPAYRSGEAAPLTCASAFRCIPIALPFRPPLVTPEPVIHGTQTAIVVGPPGEKIFTDKYGRVKIQMLWDREWKKTAESSCWVRVSQNWGGGNWGGMNIPHVGQEVVVAFEEGDPDRPLIVGRVYNAEQMPPVALPAGKTQSILRDHGDNQIIMEGDGGKQQIMVYSPEGGTSLIMGAPPPAQIPVAADAGGSGAGAGDPVTQCCPACPGEKPPPADPPQGFWATTGGFFSLSVASDWLGFVGGDKHSQIVGNSLTYVQGVYVQHVVGDVRVRTLGMSTTTIIGMENTLTVGVKNEVMCALNNRLIKGGLVEINSAKELFKSPSITHTVGKVQEKIGEAMMNVGRRHMKVYAKLYEEANDVEYVMGSENEKVKGTHKHTAAELREKADKYFAKAGNWAIHGDSMKMKGQLKIDGKTNILGNLKVSS